MKRLLKIYMEKPELAAIVFLVVLTLVFQLRSNGVFLNVQNLQGMLGLLPEVALVKAHRADKSGNLQFRYTARNFNPAVAMAGKITVVEVEEIVEVGDIAPDSVHLPGIYVHRIVLNAQPEKRIEKRTITDRTGI